MLKKFLKHCAPRTLKTTLAETLLNGSDEDITDYVNEHSSLDKLNMLDIELTELSVTKYDLKKLLVLLRVCFPLAEKLPSYSTLHKNILSFVDAQLKCLFSYKHFT